MTSVAVIIPALNEEPTIADVVAHCLQSLDPAAFRAAVIVVDDGSTDATVRRARAAGARVVSHAANRGVGRAFRTGLAAALKSGADIVVNIDADGQFDAARIPDLVAPIVAGEADFVTASRFKDPALIPDMPAVKLWGNRMMSRIVSGITGRRFHDVSCGFRAYSREAALRLNLWGEFTYTQESFIDLSIKGMRIAEVPMRIRGERAHGTSRVAANLWHYGQRALKIILHSYRDFWPFQFFGLLSVPFLGGGGALMAFLVVHRLVSGSFSPHIWAGFTGGSLFLTGLLVLLAGVTGEALKRIRLNQEMILYYHRRRELRPGEPGEMHGV